MLDLATLVQRLPREPGVLHAAAVRGCGSAWLVQQALAAEQGPVLYIVDGAETAQQVADDLGTFTPAARVLSLPSPDPNPYTSAQPDRYLTQQRLSVLAELGSQRWDVLIAPASSLLHKFVPSRSVAAALVDVQVGQHLDPVHLARRLVQTGYLRVPVVEDPGTFSVRGALLDVWGPTLPQPVRIELSDDSVQSLKTFEPDSQRTVSELTSARFSPVREAALEEASVERARTKLRELCDQFNTPSIKARHLIEDLLLGRQSFGVTGYLPAFYDLEPLWAYLPSELLVLVESPSLVLRAMGEIWEQPPAPEQPEWPHFPLSELMLARAEVAAFLSRQRVLCAAPSFVRGEARDELETLELVRGEPLDLQQEDQSELRRQGALARVSHGKRAVLEPLLTSLRQWHEAALSVRIVARSQTQLHRVESLLSHRGVPLQNADGQPVGDSIDEADPSFPTVILQLGTLARGVIAPAERSVWVTEEEIFGQRAHTTSPRKSRAARAALEDLRALVPGDWVVHTEHGVGRYLGLENRVLPGTGHIELIVVEYLGGKLYLPVYRLNQIQKYSGGDAPKLDRLGGQTFAKTKARARRKAREMADELLRLYAERHQATRPALPPAGDDYAAFEAAFPYEETPDQAAAIAEVISDLERPEIMDRLVCGDVGFGKTEVALRAAFRMAAAGRQVAVLCPTTVLAQQHFSTFSRRLSETPFEVRVLSRFQSKKDSAQILARTRAGSVDILIGTHRLLSKDVQFKDLGMIVIDEEQRFGVVHKERLKQLKTHVDVLTLTATPIPRTLQLAIGGLRQMSIITTAPLNRRAIRTLVARPDDGVLREAIERELSRGGQVFYVYNRIEGLHERAARLQALVPRARVAALHGQMSEATLERTMLDFVEGGYDVLVSTAIVESGLDIPRANTMIIDRADLFGLAQLYQLRGRVGRSQERAYCYLLVPSASELSDEARSRIEALERYSELGSGFAVATLDMELRGSGDLLGAEQSGSVEGVGLELFCQMLEEATRQLRGEEVVHDVDPDLHFDVDALIPDSYVDEVGVRLSLYKRLASASDESLVMHLATEMEDRFGPAPPEAVRLVELMRIKVELRRLKVLVCEGQKSSVSLRLREDTPLDATRLAKLVTEQRAKYRLHPDGRLSRRATEREYFSDSLALADKMLEELRSLTDAA